MRRSILQKSVAVLLLFSLFFAVLPFGGDFEGYAASVPTQKQVYKKLISMKSRYPEGKSWNDFVNTYSNEYDNGTGCYAFALLMSDAAFGKEQPYTLHKNLSELKVGDIINTTINNPYGHYVIVLKKNKKSITVAEGNWNSKIHWYRELPVKSLKKDKKLRILTRYYWRGIKARQSGESIKLTWRKLSKSQRKDISGIAVFKGTKLVKKLKKTATSYTDTDIDIDGIEYDYRLVTYKRVKKKNKYTHESPRIEISMYETPAEVSKYMPNGVCISK